MNSWKCCVVLTAGLLDPWTQSSHAQTPAEPAIRKLIAGYARSIDTADPELAAQIWSHSGAVSFIHPLGHEHGLDQIIKHVYGELMGNTFSERKLSIHDPSIHMEGTTAWVEFYWDFAAKMRSDGSPLATKGRETQIYRKEQDGWRLVHVHYSGMPVTAPRQGF